MVKLLALAFSLFQLPHLGFMGGRLQLGWGFGQEKLSEGFSKKTPRSVETSLVSRHVGFSLNHKLAKEHLQEMSKIPHPFGSRRQRILGDWIDGQLRHWGLRVIFQEFVARVPISVSDTQSKSTELGGLSREQKGRNIIAFLKQEQKSSCVVLIGSHYDSKRLAGGTLLSLGANDSGSSSVLLMQLAHFFQNNGRLQKKGSCDPVFIWFDGEEAVLPDWDDGLFRHPYKIQDNTYGSRYFAEQLKAKQLILGRGFNGQRVSAFVLLDMLGSPGLKITNESFSNSNLKAILSKCCDQLAYSHLLQKAKKAVLDDHIPFVNLGIPSLNIIDFENLDHWHKSSDTIKNISFKSLEIAGEISACTVETILNSFD